MSINSNKALLEANVMLLNVQVARTFEVSQPADGQNHPQGWGRRDVQLLGVIIILQMNSFSCACYG